MNSNRFILFTIITTLSLLIFSACSTDSSDSNTATINGSVEEEPSQQKANQSKVEGAVITAARITSNGSFDTIEGVQTETNASGNFTLEVDAESAENIIIKAETESEEWYGFLADEVENGQSYSLKPINSESTAETQVYSNLVATGDADIVQKADIEAVVSGEVAADIESGTTAVARYATGLANSAEARVDYFQETQQDNAESMLTETYTLLNEAQIQLEADLAASANAEQREGAYEVFLENTVNAYVSAGLDASDAAKLIEMWGRVFINSLTSVSSDIKEDARKQSSILVAIAIDNAVRAEAEATSMSEASQEAIVEAGIELKSTLRSSVGAENEIETAFQAYHDEVRATMEADASFEASVIIEIDTEINSSSGAKSTFNGSISSVLSSETVVSIYNSYYNDIETIVEENMEGSSEFGAVTEIMILINLAT